MKNLKSHPLFYYSVLFMTATMLFYFYSKDINLKTAWGGMQPHDYVNQKMYPENYQKDFLGTRQATHMDKSLAMKSFYIAKKWFDIDPEIFVYPFMLTQCLFFIFGLAFLIKVLFKDEQFVLLGTCVISLSMLAGLDMSRFLTHGVTRSLEYSLYYGFAFAFTFWAVAYSIRKFYIITSLMISAVVCTHITMGLFTCVFVGSHYLFKPKEMMNKRFLMGVSIFGVISGFHVLSIIDTSNIATGMISTENWIKATKMFGYHWYPVVMKMFSDRAHKEFFPILFSLLAFVIALQPFDFKSDPIKKIVIGVCSCIVMTAIGIFCVEVLRIPIFIKMSLQRSTGLISFFGVLFYCYYFYLKIRNGDIISASIASFGILTLIFAAPGISLLVLLLLSFYDIRMKKLSLIELSDIQAKYLKYIWGLLALFSLLLTIANQLFSSDVIAVWNPLQYFNFFASFDFLLKGGSNILFSSYKRIALLLLFITIIIFTKKVNLKSSKYFFNFIVVILILILFLKLNRSHGTYGNHDQAQAYLDIQLWAKKNTPTNALFMQDPTHSYAWRDFSQRSSFGTWRDWGYVGVAYEANEKLFIEGKARMKEFGVDFDSVSLREIEAYSSFPYEIQFRENIRNKFYTMLPTKFRKLASRYGIDYVIMNKKYLTEEKYLSLLMNKLELAYKNDYFIVWKL